MKIQERSIIEFAEKKVAITV
uniref:Uncharacterized protein n=1 Tax=Nelumbo nucifera TaxID=4432 RepID=A0A822YN64_NELNU|nr:TPA_asm: hypothetical protein HUJ06_011187 [Nelumbo nucifera]